MRVKVLFFGMLKDIVGRMEEQIDLAPGAQLSTIFDHYAGKFPRLREMAGSIVMARNQEFSALSTAIAEGDEIAFLPPVSGGSGPYTSEITSSGGDFYAITRLPIDSAAVTRGLVRGEDGAVTIFEGVVRNNTKGRATRFLEYECYEPMAIKIMAEIGGQIAGSFEISRIAMVHRLGRLEIGEASVAIIVSAPHRKAAFAAALEGINRLKRLVPIWKKEHFADGEVWVEGEWDDQAPKVAHG
jgi:molybdopterin synthase catalytic subunit/molybdopterin converting factor small subunit